MKRDRESEEALPEQVRCDVPVNGLRIVGTSTLQSAGDQIVNAGTVLPWLFSALGVPAALTGLLKPIRESLSMLPQAFLTPVVLRVRRRSVVLAAGAAIQAVAVAVMAGSAALLSGLVAGLVILTALAVFALGRCLCSISLKDVQGRTIPQGERGQINGLATTAAGVVAITLGLGIRWVGGDSLSAGGMAWLLALGAVLWVGVALVSLTIREPLHDPADAKTDASDEMSEGVLRHSWELLREDRQFRRFVTVRALLLVTSLSPPYLVMLAVSHGSDVLTGLGGFVIASGVASLIGGRWFGVAADRSSRTLMSVAAGAASVVIVVVLVLLALPGFSGGWGRELVLVAGYFLVTLLHVGVRTGRKTYLVDMASGDTRTLYTAVSNTVMGVILLLVGGMSAAVAGFSVPGALILLAVLGGVGTVVGARLPEVSRG